MGWTWGLISLEFHGQSSRQADAMVFSNPVDIAPKFNLGTNPSMYGTNAFSHLKLQLRSRQKVMIVRSGIICTNVSESGVTIPNVGVVIRSGMHRRASVDVRTWGHSECIADSYQVTDDVVNGENWEDVRRRSLIRRLKFSSQTVAAFVQSGASGLT